MGNKTANTDNDISKKVEEILDDQVRPMLIMDGGNLEISRIEHQDDSINIFINYMGACTSCASGSTGTLYAIEAILRDNVDENINVIPL